MTSHRVHQYPSCNIGTPFLYHSLCTTDIFPVMGREHSVVTGCHVMQLIKQTPWQEEILNPPLTVLHPGFTFFTFTHKQMFCLWMHYRWHVRTCRPATVTNSRRYSHSPEVFPWLLTFLKSLKCSGVGTLLYIIRILIMVWYTQDS